MTEENYKIMNVIVLPEKINDMIGTQEYTVDSIGESGSEVRVYEKYVLKIQPHNQETDNEAAIVRWLNGRLLLPQIPVYTVEDGTAFTLMSRVPVRMLSFAWIYTHGTLMSDRICLCEWP